MQKRKITTLDEQLIKRYNQILKDYREYAEKLDPEVRKNFCTISAIPNMELSDGDMLYYIENGGEIKHLLPVCISRKPSSIPLLEMLPYKTLEPCERYLYLYDDIDPELIASLSDKRLFMYHEDGLCPACRLFGVTGYKGRVKFSFAFPEKYEFTEPITLPLLEKPRPTWYIPEYIADENKKVLGRKFYVHHSGWKKVIDESSSGKIPKTENNRTVQAIKENSQFKFEVFFENLEDWELGLLTYSLELEKDEKVRLAHKLGMAKALGFGSVDIEVESILIRENPKDWSEKTNEKEEFKRKGLEKLREIHQEKFDEHLKNLKLLLYFQQDDNITVVYPKLKRQEGEEVPGYEELKKEEKNGKGEKRAYLSIPWKEWYSKEQICEKSEN